MTTEVIRPFREADIPIADQIPRAAHGVEMSFDSLLNRIRPLTPECWWIMEVDGKPIGVVGATDFGDFAHIGLMSIEPGGQMVGTGSRLLQFALDQLEKKGFRSITLYSTNAGAAFYPRFGFRWSGLSCEWKLRKRKVLRRDVRVEPSADLTRIAAFDAPIFGGDRVDLFVALEREMPGRMFLAEDVNGECIGFVCAQNNVIGPFVATTPEVAAALLDAALDLPFDGAPRVLLPEAHGDGESLMALAGFEPLRTSRYFVRGDAPRQQRQKMYVQAAYSLGRWRTASSLAPAFVRVLAYQG